MKVSSQGLGEVHVCHKCGTLFDSEAEALLHIETLALDGDDSHVVGPLVKVKEEKKR